MLQIWTSINYLVVRESLHGLCLTNLRNTGDNSESNKIAFVGLTYLGDFESTRQILESLKARHDFLKTGNGKAASWSIVS